MGREMDLESKVSMQLLTVSNVLVTLGSSFCLSSPWFPLLKNDLSVPCEVLGELRAKKPQTRLKCFVCSVISYTQGCVVLSDLTWTLVVVLARERQREYETGGRRAWEQEM